MAIGPGKRKGPPCEFMLQPRRKMGRFQNCDSETDTDHNDSDWTPDTRQQQHSDSG